MFYSRYVKRLLDILISTVVLIVVSPVFLMISLVLLVQNKGDIFFYHKRVGYKERPFYVIKFKTMSDETDQRGSLLPDMERITTVGNWIRKLSLDELPQLFNVLKGDMSLVGPRPLLVRYLTLYDEEQRKRHEVKPGITGWAQVNGRNSISWERKFQLDLYYVDHCSFSLDMKILWMTILKVLKREGINQSEARPMLPFKGTKKKLYIIGAGSVGGHIALNIEEYSDEFQVEGFLDDDPAKTGTKQFGFEVVGTVKKALELQDVAIVIGIAFPQIKRKLFEDISVNSSLSFPTLVHSKAWISNKVSLGQGCVVYPGAAINYGSNLDDFVVVNMNCSLGHHTHIGRYSSLAPGINTGGHTIVEEGVDLGIGTSTLQNVRIGTDSVVGGQSMVIDNVESDLTVVGVPARPIKKLV